MSSDHTSTSPEAAQAPLSGDPSTTNQYAPELQKPAQAGAVPVPALLRAARTIARGIDNMLEPVASKALDNLAVKNKSRAMQDPAYSAIENKRHKDGSEFVTMIDEEGGLGMAEWEGQHRIYESLAQHPWWEELARKASDRPFTGRIAKRIHRHQRAVRGWDDTATWSLDTHLTATLADQLDRLAATTHGWPQSQEFPDFEDWQTALTSNAAKLRRYGRDKFDLIDPEDETAALTDAQDALRWVADHLGSLWD